jgi:transposase
MPRRRRMTRSASDPTLSESAFARTAGTVLRSYAVGALPILNDVLKRMQLEEHLRAYLPAEDGRTKPATAKTLLVLVRNLLVSREPLYGIGEWAARQAPDLLGLCAEEVARLNDDRTGRALDRLFAADMQSLALATATQVIREFRISLDELHNDSTSISFFGAYANAAVERRCLGHPTLAITWGYSKDHRPDLKQLLLILTISRDGGVPVHFRAASGNTTDDRTHRDTWELLCRLAGRPDFLYVADSKLATAANMAYIDTRGGRFISVLPRTRSEDDDFRRRLLEKEIVWQLLEEKTDECGELVDRVSVCPEPSVTREGYRLLWYHSTRKAELDAIARDNRIQRAMRRLGELRRKLVSPRTRYRTPEKVQKAVARILQETQAEPFLQVEIVPHEEESFHQAKRGRPTASTPYLRKVRTRLLLNCNVDVARVAEAATSDGVFPLVTNVMTLSPDKVLAAYKRQPTIEKRFSQLKTDFAVAPVYLKSVHRIEALLCVYFFALVVEALVERELRRAMQRKKIESLPMYPEGRPCRRPTARRVIDLSADVQRHELTRPKRRPQVLVTNLTRLQRRILRLLNLKPEDYGN